MDIISFVLAMVMAFGKGGDTLGIVTLCISVLDIVLIASTSKKEEGTKNLISVLMCITAITISILRLCSVL